MDTDRWMRVRQLFEQAAELPGGERVALLRDRAREDELLVSQARRLLAADGLEHTAVEQAGPAVVQLLQPAALLAELGSASVEPYRIVRPLGRGGMGAVYLAERADGAFERTVALKLVHGGFDSAEIVRRFREERRILAAFEHPNIARLYDAGVASDGRPFLVMEHVEGEAIDEYAERRDLGLRARIRLFIEVCAAVTHAHQGLVIHRDIKPSNVLVGEDGAVKLLDFGIAKITDPNEDGATPTEHARLTPDYASPEQLRGEVLSTSTDVFSLGVVLYELLAGTRPFEDGREALAWAFRGGDDRRPIDPPSRRVLRTEGPRVTPALAARGRALGGDLDRILFKALAWDTSERYQSVAALAADLEAYLEGRPVSAQPPSATYRLGKFVRRNRVPVGAVSLAVVGLVATTAVAVDQARRADEQRDTAVGVSAFLEELFQASDPRGGELSDTTALGAFLESAVGRVRGGLGDQPVTRARLLYVLGSVYRNLSRADLAIPLLADAVAANYAVHGPGHEDEIQARELLGLSFVETGSFDAGVAQLDTALTLQRAREGDTAMLTWRLQERLGQAYATVQRNEEALPYLRAVVEATSAADPYDPARHASALNVLGSILAQMGRFVEAVDPLATSADLHASDASTSAEGGRPLDEGVVRGNLAFALLQVGRVEEAEVQMRRSLALIEPRVPAGHQLRAQFDFRLAEILAARESRGADPSLRDEAEALFRAGLDAGRPLPQLRVWLLTSLSSYGRTLRRWGRLEDARSALEESVVAGVTALGGEHPMVWAVRSDLGLVLAESGQTAEGERLTSAALEALAGAPASLGPQRVNAALNHARVLLLDDRSIEAVGLLEASRAEAVAAFPPDHPMLEALEALVAEGRDRGGG